MLSGVRKVTIFQNIHLLLKDLNQNLALSTERLVHECFLAQIHTSATPVKPHTISELLSRVIFTSKSQLNQNTIRGTKAIDSPTDSAALSIQSMFFFAKKT